MTLEVFIEVFIILFIGIGPVKVLLVYLDVTQDLDSDIRKQMVRRIVTVAGVVGLGLFAFGAFLQNLLHFSIGALTVAGGLILLLLALNMVLGSAGGGGVDKPHKEPMSLATSPLAIPLTLNPIGIVALVVFSSSDISTAEIIAIIVMILIILLVDFLVLSSADRLASHLSHASVELLEKVLGILLAALAIELMFAGLAEAGIITLSGG